jgi:hypothetical protein
MESLKNSEHMVALVRKMYNRFQEHWGCGDPSAVATEHLSEGPRRRPKGISKLALIASLVDPRFKIEFIFSNCDKEYIWNIMREIMMVTAFTEQAEQEPRQIC